MQLISHIYRCTSFSFCHRGESTFATLRGIRQGCKTAPILWCLYMEWIMHRFGDLTDMQWMLNHNTIFADDWCLYDMFESPDDLQVLLLRVGKLFDLLESLGLIVNSKTVAILHMQGKQLTPALRKRSKEHYKEPSSLSQERIVKNSVWGLWNNIAMLSYTYQLWTAYSTASLVFLRKDVAISTLSSRGCV